MTQNSWPFVKNEYYLLDGGGLLKRIVVRTNRYGRWPRSYKPHHHRDRLVAAVVRRDRKIELEKGPAFEERFVPEVLRLENDVGPTTRTDLGKQVPVRVRSEIRKQIERVAGRISGRFDQYTNETGMLDALMDQLDDVFVVDGWKVRMRGQGFSPITKEPKVGADAGWIVEVTNGADRVVKAMWMQAKQVDELPGNLMSLPDLDDQMTLMRSHTRASYALLFTRHGVFVADRQQPVSLDEALIEGVQCDRGDLNERIVAMTLDRSYVGLIEVAHD